MYILFICYFEISISLFYMYIFYSVSPIVEWTCFILIQKDSVLFLAQGLHVPFCMTYDVWSIYILALMNTSPN